jgi:hypothetical protein
MTRKKLIELIIEQMNESGLDEDVDFASDLADRLESETGIIDEEDEEEEDED